MHPYHIVDAFTAEPFAGNPAAVMLMASFPADVRMQVIAREFNLAETAFLVPVNSPAAADAERPNGIGADGVAGNQGLTVSFHLRWFTPTVEVDLCGHATLASAHFLFSTGRVKADQTIVFHTRSGPLTCRKEDASIVMDFPAEPPAPIVPDETLLSGLNLVDPPLYVGKNRMDVLVEVADAAIVRGLNPNMGLVAKVPARCVIVTAKGDQPGVDMVSRVFGPAVGVNEDPVTGSAHCGLAVYWATKLQVNALRGFQASARGGTVDMELKGDRVFLKGAAVTVAQGNIVV